MGGLWYDSIQTSTQMELMCREEPSLGSYNYGEDLQVLRERIAELEAELQALREAAQGYLDNRMGGRDRLLALLEKKG